MGRRIIACYDTWVMTKRDGVIESQLSMKRIEELARSKARRLSPSSLGDPPRETPMSPQSNLYGDKSPHSDKHTLQADINRGASMSLRNALETFAARLVRCGGHTIVLNSPTNKSFVCQDSGWVLGL
nr:hypothetical protein L203_06415 [Cryptococcus depauperatus CBS 7841]